MIIYISLFSFFSFRSIFLWNFISSLLRIAYTRSRRPIQAFLVLVNLLYCRSIRLVSNLAFGSIWLFLLLFFLYFFFTRRDDTFWTQVISASGSWYVCWIGFKFSIWFTVLYQNYENISNNLNWCSAYWKIFTFFCANICIQFQFGENFPSRTEFIITFCWNTKKLLCNHMDSVFFCHFRSFREVSFYFHVFQQ